MLLSALLLTSTLHAGDIEHAQRRAAFFQWNAGVDYVLSDEPDKAAQAWHACLRMDPGNQDCRAGIKLIEGRAPKKSAKKKKKRAVRVARAPKPDPKNNARRAVKHWNSGIIYFQKGDYQSARREWGLCRAADPANGDCASGLRRVEAKLRPHVVTPSATLPAPDSLEMSSPTAPAISASDKRSAVKHWNKGIKYFQQGDYKKARKAWKSCEKKDPSNLDCSTGLRRIQASYGGGL